MMSRLTSGFRAIYSFFYEIFFGCSHGHLTRPFTLQTRSYKVCLDCGKQFPYSLEQMRVLHAWETAEPLPQAGRLELTPVPIAAGFADSEDYRPSKAVA
jgi:hypothetical protein